MLRAAAAAPAVALDRLAPKGTILIVSPHPDDETLGCGMALAAAAARGCRIAIVLLTDGEASHPNSTKLPRDDLVALRFSELKRALRILAPETSIPVLRLHQPDGRSRVSKGTVSHLVQFAQKRRAVAVWSTWEGDPHCDHQTAGQLGRSVAEEISVPYWAFVVWGRFGDRPVPVDISTFHDATMAERKRSAIAGYRSQINAGIADDPTGFVMPPALVTHFTIHPELFVGD